MKYDLVFEGGGAKGMIFVGAMQEFEARGHTFNRLLGTSAGAITATLLAAGYSAQEMLDALNETQPNGEPVFASFMGAPATFSDEEIQNSATRSFLRNIDLPGVPNFLEEKLDEMIVHALMKQERFQHFFSFIERGGWYAADNFINWLKTKLDAEAANGQPRQFSHMTLSEFFAATDVEITLVASDITSELLMVLNHHTAPDCPVVWAVRMSMSIPMLWQHVEWQTAWGHYRGRDITGHNIVDGALLSNFPIELFLSTLAPVTAVMGDTPGEDILGFLIDESQAVEATTASTEPASGFGQLQTVQRLGQLVNTMTQAHDKMVIEEYEDLIVRLPAGGYGLTEFDMSDTRREMLIAAGRHALQQYFDRPPEAMPSFGMANSEDPADRIATKILEW